MKRVVVAGHICVDLIPRLNAEPAIAPGDLTEIGPLAIVPGGSVSNTGGALSALGVPIEAFATIGNDIMGGALTNELSAKGIATAGIEVRRDANTSYSIVIESAGRSRSLWHHVGAAALFDGTKVIVDGTDLVHIGYPPVLPGLVVDAGAPLRTLLRRAKEAGATTSLDMSVVDPHSAAGTVDWNAFLSGAITQVDVLTPSLDDLVSMNIEGAGPGRKAISRVADRFIDDGAAVIQISDGERGFLLRTGSTSRLAAGGAVLRALPAEWANVEFWIASERVRTIVTTNGAGDTLTAGLLYGLLNGLHPTETGRFAAHLAATRIRGGDLKSALSSAGLRKLVLKGD